MGATYVTTEIRNLSGQGKRYRAEFLVDTGATDCMVPASQLKAVGVKPEGKALYERTDGNPVEMYYGFARVSFLGDETVAQVMFGPEGCERSWAWWPWRTRQSPWMRRPIPCESFPPSP